MIDTHLHYTGSMPRQYVFDRLGLYASDFLIENNINNFDVFCKWIDSRFSDDYVSNRHAFNEVYKVFQLATKVAPSGNIRANYINGAYALSKCLNNIGIHKYTIIAGPCHNIDDTYNRILGMIEGFEKAEKELGYGFGRINLTFIRNDSGGISNCPIGQLADICKILQDPYFTTRCVGFDISGYEYPEEKILKSTLELFKYIKNTSREYGLNMSIGLHAGETITNTPQDAAYDDFFYNLAKLRPDNIGHGTYLWSDTKNDNLLKEFKYGCRFDICPHSNQLLTPIKNATVYLEKLQNIGIQYQLCRDDPAIFNNWRTP